MRYGLIEIRDWIFYFSDETKKKTSAKKKNGRKTAIKFSESARFLPVGRARSNKHLFIFGPMLNKSASRVEQVKFQGHHGQVLPEASYRIHTLKEVWG